MITQQDLINWKIKTNAPKSDEEILKELINEDRKSAVKKRMNEGDEYYRLKHDICDRRIMYIDGTTLKEDKLATNNRLVHPFHRNLVDQKKDTILSKPPSIDCEDETQKETIMGLIDGMTIEDDNLKNPKKEYKNFLRKFTSLLKGASNKGVEWINVYRDKTEGAPIRWAVVDARQCIPIWETVYQEKLSGMIRYYSVSTTIASDESQDLITAEWWDDKNVRRFQQQSDGSYLLLSTEPHWQVVFSGNAEPQPNSLGTVPWIPVANNDEYITDLEAIKSLIDDYDLLTSDRSNTLTDLQDAILAVKGYEGDSEVELRLKIKHNKIIRLSTDSEADAKAITYEPPSQAHTEHLDREERDIHLFGRGVKMRSDEAGGNPSGVALKMMTTWLLLKCSAAEAGLSIAFSQLVWFITEYLKEKGISYDPSAISIKFNQALILNESEVIDNCVNSKGVSDLETIVSHHPWNVDPKTVLDNLKNETLELAAIDNAVGTQKIDKMGLSGEGK